MKEPNRLTNSITLTNPHSPITIVSLLIFTFALALALPAPSSPSAPTVHVQQGTLHGVAVTYQKTGKQYQAFRGIPYAKPPLGELRFAKPLPHGSFKDGVHNASVYGASCVQETSFLDVSLSEDCLTLNVFVPEDGQGHTTSSSNKTYPVLVFIHGGGFVMGSARSYEMAAVVTEGDVILVTLQYRLGILGFLSTGDSTLPGNFGLWDQLLALHWVKDNIAAFGGDPNSITVSGESAGSASVSFLSLSPHSPPHLFHKAILQSGTATSSWALTRNPRRVTTILAQRLGCHMPPSGTSLDADKRTRQEQFMACLRAASVESLMTAGLYNRSAVSQMTDFVYVPHVDGDFVPHTPHDMLNDSRYLHQVGFYERDYLSGVTNNEGAILYDMASAFGYDAKVKLTDPEFFDHDIMNALLEQRFGESNPSREKIASFFYTAPRLPNRKRLELTDVLDSQGDVAFYVPLVDFARAVAMRKRADKRNLVYYFNHYPQFMTSEIKGIPHGMDLGYEMDLVPQIVPLYNGNVSLVNEEDNMMGQAYRSIILDFVRFSAPGRTLQPHINGNWTDFDETDESFLSLSPHNSSVLHHLHGRRVALWLDFLPQFKGDHGESSTFSPSSSSSSSTTPVLIIMTMTMIPYFPTVEVIS